MFFPAENPEKIIYIDELDEEGNVNKRLGKTAKLRKSSFNIVYIIVFIIIKVPLYIVNYILL